MSKLDTLKIGFHEIVDARVSYSRFKEVEYRKTSYKFYNHFHPFTAEMIEQLNKKSIAGLFDVYFQSELEKSLGAQDFFAQYQPQNVTSGTDQIEVLQPYPKKTIDLSEDGPYSIYNWELLFHAPLTLANHLYKNQRYDEAEKYLKLIFDPTTNEVPDPANPAKRFWKFSVFREAKMQPLQVLLGQLSDSSDNEIKIRTLKSIEAWRDKPFQPHVVARTRFLSYQYKTIMLWLDIYITRGDSFFRQFTPETVDMALINYVQASSLLGQRPQKTPQNGKKKPETFHSLRKKIDAFGNAMIDLEADIPLNRHTPNLSISDEEESNTLFGVTQTPYFGIPQNDKLLKYWDVVEDRLFKIRHCMNIDGVEQSLALFDPPIDPGMLVKAVAAGLDIGSIISGLNQPLSIVRAALLTQKALEFCNEVKALGSVLLSAIEKKEAEKLTLLRQGHEMRLLQLAQDVKYMQWNEAKISTDSLLKSHKAASLKYNHYQKLLGKAMIVVDLQSKIDSTRGENPINKESFDAYYQKLVEDYTAITKDITDELYREEETGSVESFKLNAQNVIGTIPFGSIILPTTADGANLGLNSRENIELNYFMPIAHGLTRVSGIIDTLAGGLALIPEFDAHGTPLGVGAATGFGGREISTAAASHAKVIRILADEFNYMSGRASKLASYQRRTEDWVLQRNLAANELAQVGRQIMSSLLREQITKKEYENHIVQVENSQAVNEFYQNKFTQEEFYNWMQNEVASIYFDAYKFAFDTARRAELTMKRELMRPELDEQDFIKFGYWDSTRKGLLAGENLYADIRRMEMAYHDNNRREYEITKHISLLQLNPYALLQLKIDGKCNVEIPEWLFDLDSPGQYMRRIKTASFSIPCIAGPYTSVNCKIALTKSSIRTSALLKDDEYLRDKNGDDRFVDYYGAAQTIITSNAQNDSGLFETNLRDERYLPFEGAGVISSWTLELNNENRQFDYNTISDVVFHIRYTAREAGRLKLKTQEEITALFAEENNNTLFRLFSLRHEFPTEWHRLTIQGNVTDGVLELRQEHFPYFTNTSNIQSIKINKSFVLTKGNELTLAKSNLKIDEMEVTIPAILGQEGFKDVLFIVEYTVNE
ncbi:Tc toxin subunit A-related protein [Runella limosa]|uniref:Tc toxin subunit A-related protein n=1 Tax=Runella limosa TaxID=370978 RepID=UPI00040EFB81|nr:hypothetical protein [Runella limosa]